MGKREKTSDIDAFCDIIVLSFIFSSCYSGSIDMLRNAGGSDSDMMKYMFSKIKDVCVSQVGDLEDNEDMILCAYKRVVGDLRGDANESLLRLVGACEAPSA